MKAKLSAPAMRPAALLRRLPQRPRPKPARAAGPPENPARATMSAGPAALPRRRSAPLRLRAAFPSGHRSCHRPAWDRAPHRNSTAPPPALRHRAQLPEPAPPSTIPAALRPAARLPKPFPAGHATQERCRSAAQSLCRPASRRDRRWFRSARQVQQSYLPLLQAAPRSDPAPALPVR